MVILLVSIGTKHCLVDLIHTMIPIRLRNLKTDAEANTTSFLTCSIQRQKTGLHSTTAHKISQTIKNYNSGERDSGLRLWKAIQRDVIRLDSDAIAYSIKEKKYKPTIRPTMPKLWRLFLMERSKMNWSKWTFHWQYLITK